TPKPAYSNTQILGSFAGPLRIPGVIKNGPNLFLGYQHVGDHNVSTQSALVPTLLERTGDFSQSRDAFGRPLQILDPTTASPVPGNVIPSDRISRQAAALLGYYPQPNVEAAGRFNYQTPVLTASRQDSFQTRFSQIFRGRNQLFGNIAYQRTTTDTGDVFGFVDSTRVSGIDAAVNWSHRVSQFGAVRFRYQYTRVTT